MAPPVTLVHVSALCPVLCCGKEVQSPLSTRHGGGGSQTLPPTEDPQTHGCSSSTLGPLCPQMQSLQIPRPSYTLPFTPLVPEEMGFYWSDLNEIISRQVLMPKVHPWQGILESRIKRRCPVKLYSWAQFGGLSVPFSLFPLGYLGKWRSRIDWVMDAVQGFRPETSAPWLFSLVLYQPAIIFSLAMKRI